MAFVSFSPCHCGVGMASFSYPDHAKSPRACTRICPRAQSGLASGRRQPSIALSASMTPQPRRGPSRSSRLWRVLLFHGRLALNKLFGSLTPPGSGWTSRGANPRPTRLSERHSIGHAPCGEVSWLSWLTCRRIWGFQRVSRSRVQLNAWLGEYWRDETRRRETNGVPLTRRSNLVSALLPLVSGTYGYVRS